MLPRLPYIVAMISVIKVHSITVPSFMLSFGWSLQHIIEEAVIERLHTEKGHNTTESSGIAVVQGINRLEDGWFDAHSDSRKGGWPAGY